MASRSWSLIPAKRSLVGVWKNISKIESDFQRVNVDVKEILKSEVGWGNSTFFWTDLWIGEMSLMTLFPSLFVIEKNKWVVIQDCFKLVNGVVTWKWRWRQEPSDNNERAELNRLSLLLSSFILSDKDDHWKWGNGAFDVSHVKNLFAAVSVDSTTYSFPWNSWAPSKVNIFGWRASMGKIPTLMALDKRKVAVANKVCKLYGDFEESVEHLFISCEVATMVWLQVSQWCNVPPIYAFSFKDLMDLHKTVANDNLIRKMIHAIILVSVWCIWVARNDSIFNNKIMRATKIVEDIKLLSLLWVKTRMREKTINWCFKASRLLL